MSKERYTVECLAAGQPRPYADSVYRYRVTIEWQGMEGYKDKNAPYIPRPELHIGLVKKILFGLCGGWGTGELHHEGDTSFGRKLTKMEQVEPGVWEVVIVEPYMD